MLIGERFCCGSRFTPNGQSGEPLPGNAPHDVGVRLGNIDSSKLCAAGENVITENVAGNIIGSVFDQNCYQKKSSFANKVKDFLGL